MPTFARVLFALLLLSGVYIVGIGATVIDQASYVIAVTAALAFLLPLGLQWAPASWRGARMALIARAISGLLALAGLFLSGQLDHFDVGRVTLLIGAYIGLTSTFFDLFKDPWHLADPPGLANPNPHTQIAADIGPPVK